MEVYNSMGQRGGTKSSGARSQKQWEGMVRDRGVRSQGGKDHKAEELGLYSAAAGKHWKGAIWSNSPLTLNWVSILRPQNRQSFISLQRGVQASPELTKQQQLAHDRLLTNWGFSASLALSFFLTPPLPFLTNPSMSGSKKIQIIKEIKITYERCPAQGMPTHSRCCMNAKSFPFPRRSDKVCGQSRKAVVFWLEKPRLQNFMLKSHSISENEPQLSSA